MTAILLTSIAVLVRILANPFANVFQKQLTNAGHQPLRVNFLTYFFLSIACIFFAWNVQWLQLPREFWIYSILGGIAGGLGNGFLVKALKSGDLSVLGPVNSYKSVVGMIFGFVLLQEVPGIWGLAGVVLIIYGSYFVLDTTADRFSWALLKRREIQFRIYAMVLTAIEAVFVKKVILVSSVTISFISWCWFGTLFALLFLWGSQAKEEDTRQNPGVSIYLKYLLLIVCVGIVQFTTNYAFEHMPVGYALSLFQLSTIVSVLLGHRVFREEGIRKKLIGSIIMIAGSVFIILSKK